MAADKDDLFREVAPNTGWQLASGGIDASVTTIPLVSAANLPTGTAVTLTIDRVDSSKKATPALMERITGVVDGSNIVDCVRGVEGTAQAHSGGAVVEIVISAKLWNDLVAGILTEHNQDGTHILPLHVPQGFLINGKIVPSVASNNLTVSIKTLAGTDPSATDPVYCHIGDTVRSITAAISVTKNAGTNWCNSGSSELATKEVDYFVYLGYNETDGVVIGFSRIPYGTLYSDFSAITINERYCAISTITNASAGDNYVNIGRFAATLSAGAGYTWSAPTFTTSNLIQRQIFETRWLLYVPTIVYWINAPTSTTNTGRYKIAKDNCFVHCQITGTQNGSNSGTDVRVKIPLTGVYVAGFGGGGKLPALVTGQWTDDATFDETATVQANVYSGQDNVMTQFPTNTRRPKSYLMSVQYPI